MKRLAAVSLILVVAGCGSSATVKGRVTYKNEPLKFGSVTVVASDGNQYPATINESGDYEVKGVPLGKAKFFVRADNPELTKVVTEASEKGKQSKDPAGRGAGLFTAEAKKVLSNPNLVPDKYSDFTKELLVHNVTSGENRFDIKLEP